jgi:hypothetical protein
VALKYSGDWLDVKSWFGALTPSSWFDSELTDSAGGVNGSANASGVGAVASVGVVSATGTANTNAAGIAVAASTGAVSANGAASTSATGTAAAAATVGAVVASGRATVTASGISATSATGATSETGAANTSPAGISATVAVGQAIATGGAADAFAFATGILAHGSVGVVTAKGARLIDDGSAFYKRPTLARQDARVEVAGVEARSMVGAQMASGSATATASGVSGTASVGTVTALDPWQAEEDLLTLLLMAS